MAKTSKKTTQSKRKNKLHLKKSARWTIAGLMLATAVIIALIPVQNGGVSAITAYTVPDNIDDVVNDTTGHGIVTGTNITSVDGSIEYAFPIEGEPYSLELYKEDGTTVGNYIYADIDMTSMDVKTTPVVIYKLGKSAPSKEKSDCITKYIGDYGSGSTPKDGKMKLGSTVIVPDNTLTEGTNHYFSGPKPDRSGTRTEYLETVVKTNTLDGIAYSYVILQEKVWTYEYTEDDPSTPDINEEKQTEIVPDTFDNPRYVVKSGTANVDNISRTIYLIGDEAFSGVSNIEQMEIPSGVGAIGNSAFEGCTNLQSVILSNNCKTIGDKAFANASKLKNIDISNALSLQKIGDGAFANTGIESVKFPSSPLEQIGSGAFYGCSNLSNVDFSNTAGSPGITLGCYCFAGCPIESISLDNVTRIISHDGSNNRVETPVKTTPYDPNNAKCGIFTKLEDQNSVLKEVTFPSYDGILPYGTFAGNNNLSYVKFDKPNGQPYDIEESGNQHNDKDEFYYEPENFFIFGGTPSNSGPASYLYAAKNGITYGYIKDGVLTYELTKNGYKYTFAVLNDGECKITNIEQSQIVSPESEMIVPGKIAQYVVKEIASEVVDVATLSVPTELSLPDTLQTIEDRAFVNMPNLTKVSWYDADNSASSPEITIGNEAFAGDSKITEFVFRDDNHAAEYVNDPNIISVGTDAFKTLTTGSLKMQGKMGTGYAPFDYATNPDNRFNTTSSTAYAIYQSGNPENLVCQYDPSIINPNGTQGAVSLLSYPTRFTKVSRDDEGVVKKISDLTGDISVVEETIIDCLKNIIIPEGVTSIEKAKPESDGMVADLFKDIEDTVSITLYDVNKIPDKAFASTKRDGGATMNDIVPSSLQSVSFMKDIVELGETPFINSKKIAGVGFYGEGDSSGASDSNPYYWSSNGIIYSYTGLDSDGKEKIAIEECLPSRGESGGNTTVEPENDADLSRVNSIKDKAFMNCDSIKSVDLSSAESLREISKQCFYDADNLSEVILPANCDSILEEAFSVESGNNTAPENYIDVYVPDIEVYINASAFDYNKNATLHSYNDSAAEKYAKDHPNVDFKPLTDRVKATYIDFDGTVLAEFTLDAGDYPDEPSTEPQRTGFTFIGWSPKVGKIYTNTTYVAQYSDDSKTSGSTSTSGSSSSGSGSSTGSGSSSGSGSNGSGSSSSSTNKSSSSSSSSTTKSSSGSSTYNRPVVISGAPTPVVQPGSANSSASGGAASSSPSGSNVTTGNTNVVSTAPGLSNNGKMSATVNGSSDNYVIKLTETAEADECAKQALSAAFGSLDNIRYMPFDISLYDSTGTQKISPVPEGVTVSVTMPIPDSLQVYGGNNKVASTVGGTLESIKPRFTVIDGVPCMNFTVSHLSPYVIYVDTANLTASGTLDATPKTGDPIHPKWFLCIGLTAISIFLFLKRDKDTLRAA